MTRQVQSYNLPIKEVSYNLPIKEVEVQVSYGLSKISQNRLRDYTLIGAIERSAVDKISHGENGLVYVP